MAYDASKEKQEVIDLIAKNDLGDYIKITQITRADGSKAVDVREYYTDKRDMQSLLPSKRGVRLSADTVVEVMVAMVKGLSEGQREEFLEKTADALGVELGSDEDDEDAEDAEDAEGDEFSED